MNNKDENKNIRINRVQPLIPIKEAIIFPNLIVPLHISRKSSKMALHEAMAGKKILVFAAQRDSSDEEPKTTDVYSFGCAAKVLQILNMPDESLRVIVQGLRRVEIKSFIEEKPFFRVKVKPCEEIVPDADYKSLMKVVVNKFKQMLEMGKFIPPDILIAVLNIKKPGHISDVVSFYLTLSMEEKEEILEELDVEKRIQKVVNYESKELEVLKLNNDIQSRAKKEISKSQHEYYLRQQLKAIQEELGFLAGEKDETSFLAEKVKNAKMPKDVEEVALKELGRLQAVPFASAEKSVIRTYLDYLIEYPWSTKTKDKLDIKRAKKVLDRDHYGLKDVKERILEFLAVRTLSSKTKGPILCFVGPPGVGKTSLGKSIAEALGRKFIRISLGGIRDEAEIRGHRRTYVGALPGKIIRSISQANSNNPLFMMDEIDKIGMDYRGDPSSALLEALDPEQNTQFRDHYMEVPVDLSSVFFIMTANFLDPVPPALKDRMEVINLAGYTEEEKLQIARNYLVPKQLEAHGFEKRKITIKDNAILKIIREYTREAGVRSLERNIAGICRKIAKAIVENKKGYKPGIIDAKNIEKMLGVPKYRVDKSSQKNAVGKVNGLSWTQHGGEVLIIEAIVFNNGKGKLKLTGQLGDVMKESAQAALSYVRLLCEKENINFEYYSNDIHIHVPEGAIPKDGPSAGVTMAVAIYSALTKKPVRGDMAMTGEITLQGDVLPVGGIKEKALAALRLGIKEVALPLDNKKNLEEIPEELKDQIKFVFVEKVDDLINLAIINDKAQK